MAENDPIADKSDWLAPRPHAVVGPTYAPFVLAFGITLVFWGVVTSPIMSLGGLAMMIWALGSWLRSIAGDWRRS